MKSIILFAAASLCFAACNNSDKTETTTMNADSTTINSANTYADTAAMTAPSTTTTTTTTSTYVPVDGDVSYRDGKVMIWRNGNYVVADRDVTLDDGSVVYYKTGEVKHKDGKTKIKLDEGESVNHSGNFFDKAGEGIADGWDATKKGVKKAGQAVGKAGKKVGEEVKEIIH